MSRTNKAIIIVSIFFAAVFILLFLSRNDTKPLYVGAGATPITEYKIDINSATADELSLLDNLGESTARDIIDYRSENGAFDSIDDLKNVRGIGDKKLDIWRAYIKAE